MRAAVLLDETAEGVNLGADGNAGDVIARMRECRLQRPGFRCRVIDLMEILIDAMLGIAGNAVDLAAAFDHSVLAGRNRHTRLLDPLAGIGGFRRNARHVALFLHRCRDRGDRLVVQPEKNRKLWFCHDTASIPFTFAGDGVGALPIPFAITRRRKTARRPAIIVASVPRPRARHHRASAPRVLDWALHSSDSRCSFFPPTSRAFRAI